LETDWAALAALEAAFWADLAAFIALDMEEDLAALDALEAALDAFLLAVFA
jgi:hypothetical protein